MLFRLTSNILGLLDIIYIVYSNNYKAYIYYMQIVLKRLQDYKLYINLKTCIFYITIINFLGFIISIIRVLIEKS